MPVFRRESEANVFAFLLHLGRTVGDPIAVFKMSLLGIGNADRAAVNVAERHVQAGGRNHIFPISQRYEETAAVEFA